MPKFEICKSYEDTGMPLPTRSTENSAGYDFYAVEDAEIPSIWSTIWKMICHREVLPTLIFTHIKAKMAKNEVLFLYNRSSNPFRGLILSNGVGVVDSDYYGNQKNDGDIGFAFYNLMPWAVKITKGQKLGQGVFCTFKKTSNDSATGTRTGGYGSTGK